MSGFPNVIMAIDVTLIAIKGPSTYVCRKGYHAINVQTVCDSQLHILNIVVKWPGSTHDSYILSNNGLPLLPETVPNCGFWVSIETMA